MKILVSLLVLLGSTQSFAGDAGCGLGSMIIQKNTKVSQFLAITTNHLFFSQVFGITTGTSNCTANGFVMVEKEAQYYAETNLPSLKVDFARGEGDSLTTFATIIGCQESAIPAFGELMQTRYSEIFPNDKINANEFVQAVRLELIREPAMAHACSAI